MTTQRTSTLDFKRGLVHEMSLWSTRAAEIEPRLFLSIPSSKKMFSSGQGIETNLLKLGHNQAASPESVCIPW